MNARQNWRDQLVSLRMREKMGAAAVMRALPIIAKVEAKDMGFELVFDARSATASTDCKSVVCIPLKFATGDELAAIVLIGMVIHECGHKRYTDPAVMLSAAKEDPFVFRLWNTLEDPRMEARTGTTRPGAQWKLADMVLVLKNRSEQDFFREPNGKDTPLSLLHGWLLTAGRASTGQDLADLALIWRAKAEEVFGPKLLDEVWGLAEPALHAATAQGPLDAAKAIVELLEQARANTPQPDPEGEDSEDESEPEGDTEGEDSEDESEPEGDSEGEGSEDESELEGDTEDEDSDGDESASGGSDGDEDSEGGQDGESSGGQDSGCEDESSSVSSEGDAEGGSSAGNGAGNSNAEDDVEDENAKAEARQAGEAAAQVLEEAEDEEALKKIMRSLEEALQEQFEELFEEPSYSSQGDAIEPEVVTPLPDPANCSEYARTVPCARATAEMALTFERLLEAEAEVDRWSANTGHRVNGALLHRVVSGSSRVFDRCEESIAQNTALMLLFDRSGSMGGTTIDVARSSIAAIGDVCVRQDVAFSVAAFDDEIYPVKEWDQSWRLYSRRLNYCGADGGTSMGAAHSWSFGQMLEREEPRRVIITVTDGAPASFRTLRASAEEARNFGVDSVFVLIDDAGYYAASFRSEMAGFAVATTRSIVGLPEALLAVLSEIMDRR